VRNYGIAYAVTQQIGVEMLRFGEKRGCMRCELQNWRKLIIVLFLILAIQCLVVIKQASKE
jgi:hypothetical protein